MKYKIVNKINWIQLSKENRKQFKRIMRDIHDDILEDFARCQRLNSSKFKSTISYCWNFIDGEYRVLLNFTPRDPESH